MLRLFPGLMLGFGSHDKYYLWALHHEASFSGAESMTSSMVPPAQSAAFLVTKRWGVADIMAITCGLHSTCDLCLQASPWQTFTA